MPLIESIWGPGAAKLPQPEARRPEGLEFSAFRWVTGLSLAEIRCNIRASSSGAAPAFIASARRAHAAHVSCHDQKVRKRTSDNSSPEMAKTMDRMALQEEKKRNEHEDRRWRRSRRRAEEGRKEGRNYIQLSRAVGSHR